MPEPDATEHARRVALMRERREAGLRNPEGWLSLVGLHWLTPGTVEFGGEVTSGIRLASAAGPLPPIAGSFEIGEEGVRVHPLAGSGLELPDGAPVPDGLLLVDDARDDGPTVLALGSLRLSLIRRGSDRLAIRVRDIASRVLREFTGLRYFPVDLRWRTTGSLESAEPGATIAVPDVIGERVDEPTPGDVVFEIDGAVHRLHAMESLPGHLWLVFGDATNGVETYGGGRFLVTGPVQADGSVEIDFNLAYDPPCVFTPYATCPLPPEGNRLPIRIEAGERGHAGAAGTDAGHPIGPR